MTREILEAIPSGTKTLREVRYLKDDAFDDITTDELEHAVRWFHAAAYSATEGARRVERLIRERKAEQCDSPTTTKKRRSTSPTG